MWAIYDVIKDLRMSCKEDDTKSIICIFGVYFVKKESRFRGKKLQRWHPLKIKSYLQGTLSSKSVMLRFYGEKNPNERYFWYTLYKYGYVCESNIDDSYCERIQTILDAGVNL